MSAIWLAFASVLVSCTTVAVLAWRDPERRKLVARRRDALVQPSMATRGERIALSALALSPGGVLAVGGEGASLLVWAGASMVGGWALTLALRSVR
jgi:hypothetical protein